MAQLAKKNKISRQAFSTALYRQNPRWEHEIAAALGVRPSQIWPERYDLELEIPIKNREPR